MAEILLKSAGGGKSGVAVNPQLLHNWYFPDPVNQRGLSGTLQMTGNGLVSASDTSTVINTSGYFLDRWILESGSVTLTENGLTLNGTMIQRHEESYGSDLVASVFMYEGTATISHDDANKETRITSAGGTIQAAKLEIGAVSTLTIKSWTGAEVLSDRPDFGVELGKCQRFYENSWFGGEKTDRMYYLGAAPGNSSGEGHFDFKATKRTIPTITFHPIGDAAGWQVWFKGTYYQSTDEKIGRVTCSAFCAWIYIETVSNMAFSPVTLHGHWEASADL